ncbi:acylneuraminate cytidylyltransferase family protein [Winogradskyella sp.]|uniref:acylneuraminate cytidylyltransferase family protein n=1 Tax=Winogradskyella sp. TaxID=1883156 RepID=UPI00260BC865|nr:acylneuraminate cytidylyltransferase family protein [Winogradskyella sp.]
MGKTIAIIPARGGSKRIPNKNIIGFGDLPLIAHSINYAKRNFHIVEDIYVSTDDRDIKKAAIDFGAKVIDRPEVLSGDLVPTISVLKHALDNIEEKIETMILLQPTNPLRPKKLLEDVYKIYSENNLSSLFTVSRDYKKLGKIKNDKFLPFNYKFGQRSQDLEPLYYENGLIYITNVALIKKDIIFDETSYPFIVNHKFAEIDIDTYDDLEYANYILKKYNEE